MGVPDAQLLAASCLGAGPLRSRGRRGNRGGVWVADTAGAYLLGVEGSARALKHVTPILPVVALIAERPAKAFFGPADHSDTSRG